MIWYDMKWNGIEGFIKIILYGIRLQGIAYFEWYSILTFVKKKIIVISYGLKTKVFTSALKNPRLDTNIKRLVNLTPFYRNKKYIKALSN